jgi:hypothetical protein
MKNVAVAWARSSIDTNAAVSLHGPSSKPIATSRRCGPCVYAPAPRLRHPTTRNFGAGTAEVGVDGCDGFGRAPLTS